MESQINGVASPSSADPSPPTTLTTTNPQNPINRATNPMQSWWEAVSRARSRIHSLSSIVPFGDDAIAPLADSDCPARSLLGNPSATSAISSAFRLPSSGSGDDALCQWIYETYLSTDADLRLVVLSFVPLISGLYLSRVVSAAASPSLAGFESVLLALYNAEARSRSGKPVLVSVPDLSYPSLYHSPPSSKSSRPPSMNEWKPSIGVLSPPLEPQIGVKSTKRACVVAVALDCFYKKISLMPVTSKLDLCEFASVWAGQNCPCRTDLDEDDDEVGFVSEEMGKLRVCEEKCGSGSGSRIPFPWELMQPVLRILGHCLLAPLNPQEVRDAASAAVRCMYARALHDLMPQAILATRSLIQLDRRARSASAIVLANVSSNPNTPSKQRKPDVLLASK
ncbi:hypothetical protein QJS10_CPA09g00531 [Acorus calamus]|uniref:Hyccin n=1 Tax=Acorus calamus TaxID=4465 RepID=A0AAV9E7Y9_ACOCL|nr:hypothetical protein QJS10_CPA09g00531 [Acorus calamus]